MPRKRRKKSKNYFTQDTENAIVRYNSLDPVNDEELRSDIYKKEIHYPFFKLTQNIIHTFKFYHTEVENLEHLQHEIIVFLLSKIHLFDPTRGAKAYSYFGTIVKRWLILYNTKNYNKKIISNLHNLSKHSLNSEDVEINTIPIFIVGMPRSGSTLLENIISVKNNVIDMGEVSYLEQSLKEISDISETTCGNSIPKVSFSL